MIEGEIREEQNRERKKEKVRVSNRLKARI